MAQEIIHSMKKKRNVRAFVGVKVDMAKAYDRVDWVILNTILHSAGFFDHFWGLINRRISTVHYTLLINGRSAGGLTPQNGL